MFRVRHHAVFVVVVVMMMSLIACPKASAFSISPWDSTKYKDNATFLSKIFLSASDASSSSGDGDKNGVKKSKRSGGGGGRAAGSIDRLGDSASH